MFNATARTSRMADRSSNSGHRHRVLRAIPKIQGIYRGAKTQPPQPHGRVPPRWSRSPRPDASTVSTSHRCPRCLIFLTLGLLRRPGCNCGAGTHPAHSPILAPARCFRRRFAASDREVTGRQLKTGAKPWLRLLLFRMCRKEGERRPSWAAVTLR